MKNMTRRQIGGVLLGGAVLLGVVFQWYGVEVISYGRQGTDKAGVQTLHLSWLAFVLPIVALVGLCLLLSRKKI
jgi:hypothetical protein